MPKRIQLSRRKGWRKPEGAVAVARPSKWGNPFPVGRVDERRLPREAWTYLVSPITPNGPAILHSLLSMSAVNVSRAMAVEAYQWWLFEQPHLMLALDELRGHDLACWCPLDSQPCHADLLLELANP